MDINTITVEDLANPGISADTLILIASRRGDLLQAVANHPNCPPALAQQIAAALAGPTAPHVAPPAAAPAATQGAVSDGLRQAATGFGTAWSGVQTNVSQAAKKQGIDPAKDWPYMAIAGAGILALIALLLPFVSVPGYISVSLMQGGDGIIALLLLLPTIAFGVVALFIRQKWTSLTAAILSIVAGVVGLLIVIVDWPETSLGLSVGFGAILLLLMALCLVGFGVVALILRKKAPQAQ